MRVTCVSNALDAGGAERVFVWLASTLTSVGHNVTFLTLQNDIRDFYSLPPHVVRQRAPSGVSHICRWYGWRCHLRRLKLLKAEIARTRPDVVISFIDTTNTSVLMALMSTGTPVIVSERIDPRQHRIGIRWDMLRRLYYPQAATVVVQTNAVSKWARSIWPHWKVETIPNPVFPINQPNIGVCERPPWFHRKNIVAMGRLVEQKGFDMLIEAFAPLANKFPDWGVTIFGDGPLRETLLDRANDLGIKGRIHLPGTTKEPFRVFKHTDLFILSSRYEGFPNTLCEAMACGVPVISFDCPAGPNEIIRHGIDGLLVRPSDIRRLTKVMCSLMEDEQMRLQFGNSALQVLERHNPEIIFSKWRVLLHKTVEKNQAGQAATNSPI